MASHRTVRVIAASSLIVFALVRDAFALSCAAPQYARRMSAVQRLQHRMAEYDLVFAGIPVEQRFDGGDHVVTFRVLRVFKGSAAPLTTAKDNDTFSGPNVFSESSIYLVFASRFDGGLLMSSECEDNVTLGNAGGRPTYPIGLGKGWRPH